MKILITLTVFSFILIVPSIKVDTSKIDWSKVKQNEVLPKDLPKNQQTPTPNPNEGLLVRITGGKLATPNQFPYQVGLILFYPNNDVSLCSGVLISKDWVLTAAHCVSKPIVVIACLGAHNLPNGRENGRIQMEISRRNFVIHEGYNDRLMSNDIALIRLPQSAPINTKIHTIKLPPANMPTEGRVAIASGWGSYSDNVFGASDVLRYAELQIVSLSYCARFFGASIRNTNICTDGSNRISTCQGDSGGPLVIIDKGQSQVVGLTSFGSSLGCQKGWPAVYTRVSSYLQWITKITGIRT